MRATSRRVAPTIHLHAVLARMSMIFAVTACSEATSPPVPDIVLGSSGVEFMGFVGGAAAVPQSVAITNGGGGPLTGLSASVGYPQGAATGWLAAALTGASAPTTLTLTASPGTLAAGSFTAEVTVTANGSVAPRVVTVTLVVEPAPSIDVSDIEAFFGSYAHGPDPEPFMIDVVNEGGGTLEPLSASVAYAAGEPTGWLDTDLGGSAAPATLTLSPRVGALAPGGYAATVTVGVPGTSTADVDVVLTVEPQPAIHVSTTSVQFMALLGDADPACFDMPVSSTSSYALTSLAVDVTYLIGDGFLDVMLSDTVSPATLTICPHLDGLSGGTVLVAKIALTADNAENSPREIDVSFEVRSPEPVLALGTVGASVRAEMEGADPAPLVVEVRNDGTGSLTDLSASISYEPGDATGWLGVGFASTTAPTDLTLTMSVAGVPGGSHRAIVTVDSPVASNGPQTVIIDLVIRVPLVINEIMANPAAVSDADGEWIEIFNPTSVDIDMDGWYIGDEGGNHAIVGPLVIQSGGFLVLGRSADLVVNGGVAVDYSYGGQIVLLDTTGSLRLLQPGFILADEVQWTSTTAGVAVGVIDAGADNTDANGPNWSPQTTAYGDGDFGTPGSVNDVP